MLSDKPEQLSCSGSLAIIEGDFKVFSTLLSATVASHDRGKG